MLTDIEAATVFHQNCEVTQAGIEFLERGLRAVIEVNNSKVLADMRPSARFIYEHGHLTQVLLGNKDGIDMYSADQVSALIQRNAELEVMLKPFAALSQDHQHRCNDDAPMFAINGACITYGDARKAKKATP